MKVQCCLTDEIGLPKWSFDLVNTGDPVSPADESFAIGLSWLDSTRHSVSFLFVSGR